jgi:hypothetical protein
VASATLAGTRWVSSAGDGAGRGGDGHCRDGDERDGWRRWEAASASGLEQEVAPKAEPDADHRAGRAQGTFAHRRRAHEPGCGAAQGAVSPR